MADHRVCERAFSLLSQSVKSFKNLSLLRDIALNHKKRKAVIISMHTLPCIRVFVHACPAC